LLLVLEAKNPDMLWVLVPIYLNWIITDYFQERRGTAFGNAIANGFVTTWVGVDWVRQTIKAELSLLKVSISILFILYGLTIMIEAARAKKIAQYIGRIREVSYFMIVATPIFYGVISIDLITIFAILLFFPIWYGLNELVNRILPVPATEEESFGSTSSLGDLGKMPELPAEPPMNYPPMGGFPPIR